MLKIVYNMNKSVANMLLKINSKLEIKYGMVPLSFSEVALNLNDRYKE